MSGLVCPYCNKDVGYPDDCHEQDQTYEWECDYCGKKFVFTVSYSTDYSESQADCLNGSPHNWKEIIGYPKEYFINKRRCNMCDKEITLAEKEKEGESR